MYDLTEYLFNTYADILNKNHPKNRFHSEVSFDLIYYQKEVAGSYAISIKKSLLDTYKPHNLLKVYEDFNSYRSTLTNTDLQFILALTINEPQSKLFFCMEDCIIVQLKEFPNHSISIYCGNI